MQSSKSESEVGKNKNLFFNDIVYFNFRALLCKTPIKIECEVHYSVYKSYLRTGVDDIHM